MTLTFTDIFCGAGGSSIGLAAAGMELVLAANHWPRAIETHSANLTAAEHLCADVNNYDMRRLPTTDILWASPICTENSPAGGQPSRRRPKGQLDMFEAGGHVEQKGFERTRATFHDVIRATEVHRYAAVLVENVPEVASRWELFDWWCDGMRLLGYNLQFVSVSSAHVGGETNPYRGSPARRRPEAPRAVRTVRRECSRGAGVEEARCPPDRQVPAAVRVRLPRRPMWA